MNKLIIDSCSSCPLLCNRFWCKHPNADFNINLDGESFKDGFPTCCPLTQLVLVRVDHE